MQVDHALGAVGELGREPFAEQILDLERQAQEHVAGSVCAGLARGLQDALDLRDR